MTYEENLLFIAAEYAVVYGYLIYELFIKKVHLAVDDRINRSRL